MTERIIKEGINCWKTAPADRVAFLVDARAYFRAFYQAVLRAEKSVAILGWDIDSRVRLIREEKDPRPEYPVELGEFLNRAAKRKKIDIRILIWDPNLIYRFEREAFPQIRLGWKTHRRVRFKLDDHHPFGSSLHQKIVVIDDRIAFCGGIDLTRNRWDTREHIPRDRRRKTPGGDYYAPFHDIQMAISGEAAARLGELARDRWERATG